MSHSQTQEAARVFIERWKGRGYEKGESQQFWMDLLQNVLGVPNPVDIISFENQVKLANTSFIDAYIAPTKVLIEQKGLNVDLRKAIKQSDGSLLSPFQQAKRYAAELPVSKHPRWVVTCNFKSFLVYDMENPHGEPEEILLENLEKEYFRLRFLVEDGKAHLQRELEVSIKAGELIGKLYDAFLKQYEETSPIPQSTSPKGQGAKVGGITAADLHSLNVLCVRLVFCLYAEDAGIFSKDQFYHYLIQYKPEQMRSALKALFTTLDTKIEERDRFLEENLAAFPYVNGSLFHQQPNEDIPRFNEQIADLLLPKASLGFDWSEISPTIFGAVFESTLNPETRRSGGMHYTSIENIHKVIDPLFLNDLKAEFEQIKGEKQDNKRKQKLDAFQDKLACLTFLDPACGSGNFLTETYISLRRLENELITLKYHGQKLLGIEQFNPIKVNIHQFYGIEINDFAVTVATTALWIAEAQMMHETERIIKFDLDYLPLKAFNNIHCGNALRMDWNDLIFASPQPLSDGEGLKTTSPSPLERGQGGEARFDYIMGNPPFSGARWMGKDQKQDVLDIFGSKWDGVGDLDYVTCWYKKANDYIKGTNVKCAFVSTNSITQGGAVANLWRPLIEDGLCINFAWRTFRWDSEASLKAHVHCVIVGFSHQNSSHKLLFEREREIICDNISPYLINAPNVFVEARQHPIFDVPEMAMGNQPIDDGNYLFSVDEMNDFLKIEPVSKNYFRQWYGAQEFINNKPRYCLWLGECSPSELRKMPECMKRVQATRDFRLSSKRASTIKLADRPTRFQTENMPKGNYIVVPEVSSERRRYIPIGYMNDSVLCSNKLRLMPNATLYHFGVLNSNVHMAWMRTVCGRLKSDYDYSQKIVYNNFPWPDLTSSRLTPTPSPKERGPGGEARQKIERTAQAILDARALYPDSSLADLYDEVTMPPELRKAHQNNDRAVMEAYGFDWRTMTESECVAELFKLYQQLVEREKEKEGEKKGKGKKGKGKKGK